MHLIYKIIGLILSVIVVVLLAGVVLFSLFGNRALRVGIETAATKALNVGVDIDDVDLSIFRGRFEMENLVVANPPGYEHDSLLTLGKTTVVADIRSLLKDTVHIKDIKLDGMTVVMEQKGLTSNLQTVIGSISKKKSAKEPEPAEPAKQLHIDNLVITGVTVKVKLIPIPGKMDTISLSLSPIRMTNLGTDEPINTAELAAKIMVAVATGVAQQGAGKLPEEMIASISSELKKMGVLSEAVLNKSMEALKSGKELGSEAIEKGKDIGEGIKKGIGELFKKE
ncbi:MAG: AsmA family protein [Planctomycetota bacterium]